MSQGFEGLFVVIEGPDASGKQTQAAKTVQWLRDQEVSGISEEAEKEILDRMPGRYPAPGEDERVEDSIRRGVWRLSFPTYKQTPGGRVVDAYLSGRFGDRENLSVEEIVDIFAADRKQFKELIREYLKKGGVVVCDRYREANLIHQLVDYEAREWEEKLQDIKSVDKDLPDADEIFYLDISPEEAIERISDKEKDIHELDDSYMKKSNMNGKKVAEHENWQIIDAEGTRKEVQEKVREHIRDFKG
ncbi:MAG: dTMP kinase [Candidatus Nanohalobium sp.]